VLCIYFYIKTKYIVILLIPILLEIVIELLKYKGFYIDKYIATEYVYNDYFRELNKIDNTFSNFSEGNCDKFLGFDTTDYSQPNIKKISEWCEKTFNNSITNKTPYLTDYNGNNHTIDEMKYIPDNNKFKLICDICNVHKGMKILEVGFGEGDLINYIKKEYDINVTGVSIADEQVKLIQSRGFTGYTMDSWNMTPEELGTYDLILQCGNVEYIRCVGESSEKYETYCNIIKKLLNKNGKYFITCIHFNEKYSSYSLYDYINAYLLWSGNDGTYPMGKDGFTKYAEMVGLKTTFQQERTHDYYIVSTYFMSYFRCAKNNTCYNMMSFSDTLIALFKTIAGPYYIHSYLQYTPSTNYYWIPWLWQFIPQIKNNEYIFPVTLEYILFENS